jgi:hypothetical protein
VRRLLSELAVVALVGGGLYWWKHRPEPVPAPAITGAMPDLAMPAASDRPIPTRTESAMHVEKESLGVKEIHLIEKPRPNRPEKPYGEHVALLDKAPLHALGPTPVDDALGENKPAWDERFNRPGPLAAAFGVFVLAFLVLSRMIWRGKSGGFTHD